MNIYCISGLGADERVFVNIKIKDANLIHLPWLEHKQGESLAQYAERMAQQIDSNNPIILGLSFGGMLATEMADMFESSNTIIVSSAKTRYELPKLYRLLRSTIKYLPHWLFTKSNPILHFVFSLKPKSEKRVLDSIIKSSDGHFVKWALEAILSWDKVGMNRNVVHIHGTKDRLIPSKNVEASYWVKGGGHLMIYNRASEVSRLIENELKSI